MFNKLLSKKPAKTTKKSPHKIVLEGVYKSFGKKRVLQGVDLSVREGESLVVIGGSGSGKSVMIKNIIGLMHPDKGSIKVGGVEMTGMSLRDHQQSIGKYGMLFQGGALFDSFPVWQNICFKLLQSHQITKKEASELAVEKLRAVGLKPEVAKLSPSELSGGMQKRVALARAIVDDPEMIFFDEPTTGLDPIMADVINELIMKCSDELGATTFTITHDMQSVRKIADKIAMIYEGQIIWSGRVEELDKSGNPYVEQFIHGCAEGPIKAGV